MENYKGKMQVTSWYMKNNSVARRNLCSCLMKFMCSWLMPWEKKTNWLGISVFDMPSLDLYEFILNDLECTCLYETSM